MGRDHLPADKLLLIDGNSLINRAFYGLYGRQNLTAPDGTPTGALFAFSNMLQKLLVDETPTHVVAAFDRREPTFRHTQYPAYKATRKPMPDELAVQLPLLRALLMAWGICCLDSPGYEADDLIGTLAALGALQMPVTVVSGDKDIFQLATERVTVLQPVTRGGRTETERYDPAAIRARYQIEPRQIIDLKALMGDPSDNIPGVRGIGEKGAIELISRYGSLDGVYAALSEIRPVLAQKLADSRAMAYLSRDLATICQSAPVSEDLARYRLLAPQADALTDLLTRLGFRSLLARFDLASNRTPEPATGPVWADRCRLATLSEFRRLLQITCPTWPVLLVEPALGWLGSDDMLWQLPAGEAAAIWQLIDRQGVRPVLYDYKRWLRESGLTPLAHGVHDVLIAAYLLNQLEGRPDLARIYQASTGQVLQLTDGQTTDGPSAADLIQPSLLDLERPPVSHQDVAESAPAASAPDPALAEQAHALRAIAAGQRQMLEARSCVFLADEVEFPLAAVLADMERQGFAIDRQVLVTLSGEMSTREEVLREEIYRLCGRSFNLNSPKQLSELLYRDLGLKTGKKRTGGAWSTDSDELDRLSGEHPAISLIIEYRQTAKLRATFVEGLLRLIDPSDGRVHTTFNQTLTTTGRLSSSEPNLQNIPIRMAAGQQIRRAFIAAPGSVLIDADYSQIELRLLAHLAQDPAMIEAFNQSEDIHANTAGRIFGQPAGQITAQMRAIAKTMNFSIVYGISDFGLARDLGTTVRQAHTYISEYEQQYPHVRRYLDGLVAGAYARGYVETAFGRRRYLSELKSSNRNLRQFGERAAMNTPVQGTAADLIKIAMVRVDRALRQAGLAARLILQVHDELIVEAPAAETTEAAAILKREMEQAMTLSVPLVADVRSGRSWADCK